MAQSTYASQSTNIEYVGIELELSNYALIVYTTNWVDGRSLVLSIARKDDKRKNVLYSETSTDNVAIECVSGILKGGIYRCYCQRETAPTASNDYMIRGYIFK